MASAFRFVCEPADGGMALFRRYWSTHRVRFDGGRLRLTPSTKTPPWDVAPARLDHATFRLVELDAKSRAGLVQKLDRLDASDTDALLEVLSRWGFLTGGPSSLTWLIRHGGDLAACFTPAGARAPLRPPVVPDECSLVPSEPLERVRQGVRIYKDALRRYSELEDLPDEKRSDERKRLDKLALEKLAELGGSERDPATFLPRIASPLATAWQHLAEKYAGGIAPVRCHKCGKPFTLAETEKRLTSREVRYCSVRCRVAAWRGKRSAPQKRAPRGRGR